MRDRIVNSLCYGRSCLPGLVAFAGALAIVSMTGCGSRSDEPEQTAASATQRKTYFQPSVLEWRNYLGTLDRYRRTGGEDELGNSIRTPSAPVFEPGFNQSLISFEPLPTVSSNWLRVFNSFDYAVGLQINGIPMGTLRAGSTYLLPVPETTEHVIEFFVPETDVFRRDREPMRLVARYVLQVE